MDFAQAIAAHVKWKTVLAAYIADPLHGDLDAGSVANPHRCALGRWIEEEKARLSAYAEYAALCSEHTRFHRAAAEVVRTSDRGDKAAARAMLASGAEYMAASTSVVSRIRALRDRLERTGANTPT